MGKRALEVPILEAPLDFECTGFILTIDEVLNRVLFVFQWQVHRLEDELFAINFSESSILLFPFFVSLSFLFTSLWLVESLSIFDFGFNESDGLDDDSVLLLLLLFVGRATSNLDDSAFLSSDLSSRLFFSF